MFSQCLRVIGPVADPLEVVEALIAEEQVGTVVAAQVSTEAEASDEAAAQESAATPVGAAALAEAQV